MRPEEEIKKDGAAVGRCIILLAFFNYCFDLTNDL